MCTELETLCGKSRMEVVPKQTAGLIAGGRGREEQDSEHDIGDVSPAATAKQLQVAGTASPGVSELRESKRRFVVLSPVPEATQGSVTGRLLPSGQSLGCTCSSGFGRAGGGGRENCGLEGLRAYR